MGMRRRANGNVELCESAQPTGTLKTAYTVSSPRRRFASFMKSPEHTSASAAAVPVAAGAEAAEGAAGPPNAQLCAALAPQERFSSGCSPPIESALGSAAGLPLEGVGRIRCAALSSARQLLAEHSLRQPPSCAGERSTQRELVLTSEPRSTRSSRDKGACPLLGRSVPRCGFDAPQRDSSAAAELWLLPFPLDSRDAAPFNSGLRKRRR